MPNHTFLVCFGGISGSVSLAMGILVQLHLAKIRTTARPNLPDMPLKCTKKGTIRYKYCNNSIFFSNSLKLSLQRLREVNWNKYWFMPSFFPNLSKLEVFFRHITSWHYLSSRFTWDLYKDIHYTVISSDAPVASRSLVTLGVNRRHEILYNLGIQLLFSGRPIVAFDCLVEAVQIYHTNPRLWLRLAECCIVAFQLVSSMWLAVCLFKV